MAFWDPVTRADVVRAIEEYDRLGSERFFAEYGFGPARAYVLRYGGRSYDSKAILGVAYRFEAPRVSWRLQCLGPASGSGWG